MGGNIFKRKRYQSHYDLLILSFQYRGFGYFDPIDLSDKICFDLLV